jgi:hypothetical protein
MMVKGTYRGRPEDDPGKMKFRYKGFFWNKERARKAQEKIKARGLKTKLVTYTDGFGLYVMAPHDFWKGSFILDKVR